MATLVLLLSVVAVGAQLGTQFLSISTSAQQQVGDGLLNQAMEQVRALPYTYVADGLSTTDATVTSDPNIIISGSTCTTNNASIWSPAEVIPCAAPAGQTQVPFVPHIATTSVNGTSYTVSAYPSIDVADTGSGPDVYRVMVLVKWASSQTGPKQIAAQTLVYSASTGCITQTNHPFVAPCQPFLYAGASAGGGAISVVPDAATGNTDLAGDAFITAIMSFASDSSDAEIEQVSRVLGAAATSGGMLTTATGNNSSGSQSTTISADNDPGTVAGPSDPATVSQNATGTIEDAGSGPNANWISVTPGSADAGSTTAVAAASASPVCRTLAGIQQLTGLPCGSSSMSQAGAQASLLMGLYAGASSLGIVPLSSATAQPAAVPDGTFVGRYSTSGGTWCALTSGDGCVHAEAQMSLGTVELAGLPSQFVTDNAQPSGWGSSTTHCPAGNYYLALVNYSASVTSESGILAGLPTATMPMTGQPTPYLCYWSATGYQAVAVNWGTAPPSVTFPTITQVDSSVSTGAVTVTITPALQLQATSTSTTLPSGCASVCTASASILSPVSGAIVYQVSQGTSVIADLDIQVNLGTLTAQTSYQAAP